jgi:hypothetical protein
MEEKPQKPKKIIPRCEHGNIKVYCRTCDGPSICIHKNRKSVCKICKGGSICVHNRLRPRCKDCGGNSICEHNKRNTDCKDCNGSSFCEHNKIKRICIDCKGSGICIHNHRKSTCIECKGSDICEHNKRKRYCKDCKGSCICQHNKIKNHCKDCGGYSLCKTPLCETIVNKKKNNGYCLPCCIQTCPEIKVTRNYKTKENDITDRIKEAFPNLTWIADKKVKDGCSLRRPDLLVDMGTHIIIIEVDENKHSTYDCSCENKRLMEISQDVGHRPIVFIRFNPDGYTDQAGTIIKSCWKLNKLGVMQIIKNRLKEWEERIESLKQQIQYWVTTPTEKTIEIIELYY